MGGLVNTSADITPEIKRRVQFAWACYKRFKRELYDLEAAPFTLKVRMLKAEVMETLLYGCVTWILRKEHFSEVRTCLLYTSPSPRDKRQSRMPSSA